jgi:cytochrome c-type biogenesis protein CcmF
VLTLGRVSLVLALAIALVGIASSVYGARARRPEWVAVGRSSMYGLFGVLTVTMLVLEAAFLRSDFSFRLVASHSSTTTPTFYKLTALWSSQEGSLLLWVWLMSGWASLALFATKERLREIAPYAAAVLLGMAGFFVSLIVLLAHPIQLLDPPAVEGNGLQPLLRHPSMMIHPPLLYSGYTLFTIPFAFAVGALLTRRLDAAWIRSIRRFALLAWLCLGAGILLGARWSWSELGWGGYWAWDPVENASLLPWLTGTAFLHSLMIQEKRGMLRVWNVSLVLATGILAIMGTFLVRSGILESIHAFGASTLGMPFLVLLALLMIGSLVLVLTRREELRSEARLDSLFSREAAFMLNNLALVGLCFVIMWGTFFPLISEAATGREASVGPPWFDRYTVPLAIALVFLSGIGPAIAWRRATRGNLRRNFLVPAVATGATLVVAWAVVAERKPTALAMFCAAAFALGAIGQEFWRGARARRATTGASVPVALATLVSRNRRRYGGYIVHVGMALLFLGVAASSAFQQVRDARLRPGQSVRVEGYDIRYVRATGTVDREKLSLGAQLRVSKDGHGLATLTPSRGYYPSPDQGQFGPIGRYFEGEATSEVGLKSGLERDIWTSVEPDIDSFGSMIDGIDRRFPLANAATQGLLLNAVAERYRLDPPPAGFRTIVSPMVTWIWLGGLVAIAGALLAGWPRPQRERGWVVAASTARVGRALGRAAGRA